MKKQSSLMNVPVAAATISLALPMPISTGCTLTVELKKGVPKKVLFVTDSLGNTFVKRDARNWEARNCVGGNVIITMTFVYPTTAMMIVEEHSWELGS